MTSTKTNFKMPKITEPPTAAALDLAVGDTLAASALTGYITDPRTV